MGQTSYRLRQLYASVCLGLGIIVIPGGIVIAIDASVEGWQAHHHGISGIVDVTDCRIHAYRGGGRWVCLGTFVSDDHVLRLADVELAEGRYRAAGEQVRVVMSGSRAHKAWDVLDRSWWEEPIVVVVATVTPGTMAVAEYRNVRQVIELDRRASGPPSGTAAVIDVGGPAQQMGNRARRRRRKRR